MGFLDFIKKLFAPSLDAKIDKISRRVSELRRQVPQRHENSRSFDTSIFDIDKKPKSKNLSTFEPRYFELTCSMRSLKDKRIEQEKKRLTDLRNQVNLNLNTVKEFIENCYAEKAGNLLVDSFSAIKELNDEALLETYATLLAEVAQLKEALRQKEIERKRLEKEQEEEARRKKEAENQERRAQLEQERLRKEREAKEYEDRLRSEAQKRELERKRLLETVTCKKSDGDKFLDYLRRKGIKCFYHFTDEQNLTSIKRYGGLYSWYYCINNDIIIPNPGGDAVGRDLDTRHGLQDYLSFS